MVNSIIKEICLIVATRNLLAKRRQVIRNRRRNYSKYQHKPHYATRNEQAMVDISKKLHELSANTSLKLRRNLTKICGSLVDDRNAGYRRIIFLHEVLSPASSWPSKTVDLKWSVNKREIGTIADQFAMEILSESALLGNNSKWLKLAKYYLSLRP